MPVKEPCLRTAFDNAKTSRHFLNLDTDDRRTTIMHSKIGNAGIAVHFLLEPTLITSHLRPCIRTFRILLWPPWPVLAESNPITFFFQWADDYIGLESRFHTVGSVWQYFLTLTARNQFHNPSFMPRS
jgi:hypothetical protein